MRLPRVNSQGQFRGPFRGLNLTLDPTQLSQEYCTKARNVLLHDGKIAPRMPWLSFQQGGGPLSLGSRIVGLYSGSIGPGVSARTIFAKTSAGSLYKIIPDTGDRIPMTVLELANGLGPLQPDWVAYNGWLYVLDGQDRIVKTDGNVAYVAGLTPPLASQVTIVSVAGGAGEGPQALVSYRATFYDSQTRVESDPYVLPSPNAPAGYDSDVVDARSNTPNLEFYPSYLPRLNHPQERADTLRLYRRNISLGQNGWRLIHEHGIPQQAGLTPFTDDLAESDITLSLVVEDNVLPSDATIGPFAPSRNGLPGNAGCGVIFQNRLWTNDVDKPGLVRYSAIGFPDHRDAFDFYDETGDGDDLIGGIAEAGGHIFFGKARAIRGRSGTTVTATNLSNAVALVPDPDGSVRFSVQTDIGPDQAEGNGFIKVGGNLAFAQRSGFYLFDGSSVQKRSELIEPLWADLLRTGGGFSYANDVSNEVLYITRTGTRPLDTFLPDHDRVLYEQHFGLAYHYGINGWTGPIDGGGVPFNPDSPGETIGDPTGWSRYGGDLEETQYLVIGDEAGHIYLADDRFYKFQSPFGAVPANMPRFEYATGDLPLVRGREVILHAMYLFFATVSTNNLFDDVRLRLRVILDRDPDVDFENQTRQRVHDVNFERKLDLFRDVRRRGRRVTLVFERGDSWQKGWDPSIGLVGWELQPELVGRR